MVQIQWILEILTFKKALKIEYIFVYLATLLQFILEFLGHVTTVHIGVSTEI
jgi:hypothetical protein